MSPTTMELIRGGSLGQLVGHRCIGLTDLAGPQQVARDEVRAALNGRAGKEQIDDVVLAADELVGNAIQHAGGPVSLTLDTYEKGAAVGVVDRGTDTHALPAMPQCPPAHGDLDVVLESGRGLYLVALLAQAWSVVQAEEGKMVQAVFVLPGGNL
ncbi:ATP-binding protein [Streptomyces syringium]|uniref:ATP-binding protein n=1 Tax=Streptomyces syringium TaxID=76729 RepID=UPI0033C9A279